MQAADVMSERVFHVRPETSVLDIARILVERQISALPVVDDTERLVGIVTERDLMRRPEYPVRKGLTVGHEPVGVIEKLRSAVQGYRGGRRVIAGAITPSGWSNACLAGDHAQDGAGTQHGFLKVAITP
jgi:CBS domain-containing protein